MNNLDLNVSIQLIDLDDFSNLKPFMSYDARQNYEWFLSDFEGDFDDLVSYILDWTGEGKRQGTIDMSNINQLLGNKSNFAEMCRYFIDLGLCYENMF